MSKPASTVWKHQIGQSIERRARGLSKCEATRAKQIGEAQRAALAELTHLFWRSPTNTTVESK